MSTLLLDLDHTLLDTTALTAALAQTVDIQPAAWQQAYEQFVHDNGLFRPQDFLVGVTLEQRRAFAATVQKSRQFLYPDSMAFLRRAHAAGYRLVLITFGDETWQQEKIAGLHLPEYVVVITTSQAKLNQLAPYVEHDTLVVDDKATELDAFHQHWPQLKLYWLRRPNGKYRDRVPQAPHRAITQLDQIKL